MGALGTGLSAGIMAAICAGPANAAPIDDLEDCAAHLSVTAKGVEALERECPGFEANLRAAGLDRTLFDEWRSRVDRHVVRDLVRLMRRYESAAPVTGPKLAALPRILADLKRETARPPSWWDWIRAWISRHPESLKWLDRAMDRLSGLRGLYGVLAYALIASILAGAAAAVVKDLRGGGLRSARRAGAAAPLDGGPAASIAPGLGGRAADLLRRLVIRLTATRRLSSERVLTHRELVARSTFDQDSQRAVFAAVATAAEAILYGGRPAAPQAMDSVLADGEALLSNLSDRPPA
jgi:hypothetical protein